MSGNPRKEQATSFHAFTQQLVDESLERLSKVGKNAPLSPSEERIQILLSAVEKVRVERLAISVIEKLEPLHITSVIDLIERLRNAIINIEEREESHRDRKPNNLFSNPSINPTPYLTPTDPS